VSEQDWVLVHEDDKHLVQLSVDEGIACLHYKFAGKFTKSDKLKAAFIFKEVCLYLDALGFASLFALTPNVKFVQAIVGNSFTWVSKVDNQDLLCWELGEYLWP